ncbi:hypothetical protein MRX96_048344, partial [Rhipicephalus microplus]
PSHHGAGDWKTKEKPSRHVTYLPPLATTIPVMSSLWLSRTLKPRLSPQQQLTGDPRRVTTTPETSEASSVELPPSSKLPLLPALALPLVATSSLGEPRPSSSDEAGDTTLKTPLPPTC